MVLEMFVQVTQLALFCVTSIIEFFLSFQNKKTNSQTSKQINSKDFIDLLVTVKYDEMVLGNGEIPDDFGNIFVDYCN